MTLLTHFRVYQETLQETLQETQTLQQTLQDLCGSGLATCQILSTLRGMMTLLALISKSTPVTLILKSTYMRGGLTDHVH